MEERRIVRILKTDFSAATESFREVLLQRCLKVLGRDSRPEISVLKDDELELLAAAGTPFADPQEDQQQIE
ncbi:MAG: hypothetical protein Q4D27_04545 [Coriobacteriia bacterium]|nr:hypothetical protein [Coriobacteriia bacterium]